MNVFQTHAGIIDDYATYIRSFLNIADPVILEVVAAELRQGKLWPEPLLQFNPSFEMAGSVAALASTGILHPDMADIFTGYSLYRHQVEAIKLGTAGKDFIVTSGTGSGKSLTYIGTIFHQVLSHPGTTGVTAIVVYPMNALINSQFEEFSRYKENYESASGRPFPITFGQYTGQEREAARQKMRERPPQILLTNYMMLELLLTRVRERTIRDAIYEHLRFLVFDELHTYRGRQGADVAMLIRRIRSRCSHEVLCIGTSATMVSVGSLASQREQVAQVATTLFGRPFTPEQVVHETLTRSLSFSHIIPTGADLAAAMQQGINPEDDADSLKAHPVAIWLENRVALEERDENLVRRKPQRISEIIAALAQESGVAEDICRQFLADLLQWTSTVNKRLQDVGQRYAILPFKLHQFISQTGSVYTTLDQDEHRFITLEPGVYKQDEEDKKPIFANVFSRASGHAFICVSRIGNRLEPREFRDSSEENEATDGYLIVGEDIWDPGEDLEYLPDSWVRITKDAGLQAGHFNDFVQVVRLRAGIHRALQDAPDHTFNYAALGEAVFKAFGRPFLEFANRSEEPPLANVRRRYEHCFQTYLFYRDVADLRRSWRIVLPNLEQCALLSIDSLDLDDVATVDKFWQHTPLLNALPHAERQEFLCTIFDFFRLEYAIHSENYLTQSKIKENEKQFREMLRAPWTLDCNEELREPFFIRYEPLHRSAKLFSKSMGPASALGKFIKLSVRQRGLALDLKGDHYRNFILQLMDQLELADYLIKSTAREVDRISCEEEERVSRGYEIQTYFSVDGGHLERVRKAVVRTSEHALLNLRYVPAARLVHVNYQWRSQLSEGFPIGLISGDWRSSMPGPESNIKEAFQLVKLWTSNLADALYIEPIQPLGLKPDGVITLQHALKRAIEGVFQVESNEIGVVTVGDPQVPNILLYEAAEGSLGILSQFVDDVEVFQKVIDQAITLCRYDDASYKGPASYDDLLSYYNQRDHKIIDRHLIRDALEKLRMCSIEMQANPSYTSYEDHYQAMLRGLDPNSSTERTFLDYLYHNGLRLPDAAQKCVDGLYVQPDFYYEPRIWVFCDGTPHDDPAVQAEDEVKRQAIIAMGDEVWVYYYKNNLAATVAARPDIFRKVR